MEFEYMKESVAKSKRGVQVGSYYVFIRRYGVVIVLMVSNLDLESKGGQCKTESERLEEASNVDEAK